MKKYLLCILLVFSVSTLCAKEKCVTYHPSTGKYTIDQHGSVNTGAKPNK